VETEDHQKQNAAKRDQEFDYGSGGVFLELVAFFNHIKVFYFSREAL